MIEVTDATFETAVLERSDEIPVVVDLWAPWCGPCRQLGPIVEKVVAATDGQVELVKVNTDENPETAAAFSVQSIPAVYAMKDRKVVDGFIGAQGEPAVTAFVNGLIPSEAEVEADALVAAGDEESLRKAVELAPDYAPAGLALAGLLADQGDGEEALELLQSVPPSEEARRIAALVRIGGGDADDDLIPKLDGLLDRVKEDEDARQEYVDLLEVLGADDPRTADYRKALTARLY